MFEFFGVNSKHAVPYLSIWEYCNIIMVHTLVNIYKVLKESHCSISILWASVAPHPRAAQGSPHSAHTLATPLQFGCREGRKIG